MSLTTMQSTAVLRCRAILADAFGEVDELVKALDAKLSGSPEKAAPANREAPVKETAEAPAHTRGPGRPRKSVA
jgi:hypothetical protein